MSWELLRPSSSICLGEPLHGLTRYDTASQPSKLKEKTKSNVIMAFQYTPLQIPAPKSLLQRHRGHQGGRKDQWRSVIPTITWRSSECRWTCWKWNEETLKWRASRLMDGRMMATCEQAEEKRRCLKFGECTHLPSSQVGEGILTHLHGNYYGNNISLWQSPVYLKLFKRASFLLITVLIIVPSCRVYIHMQTSLQNIDQYMVSLFSFEFSSELMVQYWNGTELQTEDVHVSYTVCSLPDLIILQNTFWQ